VGGWAGLLDLLLAAAARTVETSEVSSVRDAGIRTITTTISSRPALRKRLRVLPIKSEDIFFSSLVPWGVVLDSEQLTLKGKKWRSS
jgi:hypothetical protein